MIQFWFAHLRKQQELNGELILKPFVDDSLVLL